MRAEDVTTLSHGCAAGSTSCVWRGTRELLRTTEGKEDRREDSIWPHVAPADLGIRHIIKKQGKHEGADQQRDGGLQEAAEERLLWALEQGGGTRQGRADDKRDDEQEREREDKPQGEDPRAWTLGRLPALYHRPVAGRRLPPQLRTPWPGARAGCGEEGPSPVDAYGPGTASQAVIDPTVPSLNSFVALRA
jgi:hypothetical protein